MLLIIEIARQVTAEVPHVKKTKQNQSSGVDADTGSRAIGLAWLSHVPFFSIL
jgi:hypothetical protein